MQRSRRRPRYGAHLCCALLSALLLLLSVSLLYSRLSSSTSASASDAILLSDSSGDSTTTPADADDDRIDELDIVEENSSAGSRNDDQEDDDDAEHGFDRSAMPTSAYFFDRVAGVFRMAFNKRSIQEWDDDTSNVAFGSGSFPEDRSKGSFATDDLPVDDGLRRKVSEVASVEDALLLKVNKRVSVLRDGWGDWFDKKSDFLRKDRMFRSSLEVLNPMNNPLLQDPDGASVTGYTRGDKLMQKWWLSEFKKVPFSSKKRHSGVSEFNSNGNSGENSGRLSVVKSGEVELGIRNEGRRVERRTLDNNVDNALHEKKVNDGENLGKARINSDNRRDSAFEGHLYADGKIWGYYPGLHPHLPFSDFMDAFLKNRCDIKVFMVWNSPPWMFSVRHQRGIESLLIHHPDACVVVLSETIELDFFRDSFVKDGYKVAVVMPNLEELLADTPTEIFASVWFEWRKTKFYPTHFSELVRLAALYKYGGIYLDSDIIVLKSLSQLNNTLGQENQIDQLSLNGAVMAFRKHSPFLMDCLKEYYSTYDDTRIRWNGADLLRRVAEKFLKNGRRNNNRSELKIQPSFIFFPISSRNITRYFRSPLMEWEKIQQDDLFKKILDQSLTFHFWNSLTSALIPEPGSQADRLINHACLHCFDAM
ncbi:hypothetical protein SAY86_020771 [Trapa natans]|uniref:Alpha 1,4-glycosyltransferase domain-containing protein n=1 Tax=Trapa natans TaxID=22666 RepID=A0AAN7RCJ3_TRANT|nr:hypothetical protein SAY86_020771 [Trapa natans]